ncbi:hypothetical protein [Enterobacter ludwigii]|uniref:hypothetical protein n=1 Tax=Enterobacteriaceae TaxID=543 RepID=UPI0015E683C9|nr:hypothetical protein [Enterobacter ludwigii]
MRITFNSDSELTINTIDRYAKSYGVSRSKVISDLLDSISPALDYLVFQNSLKSEMETKLLNLFAYELKEVEAKVSKDEVFFRYFYQGIKKISHVFVSEGTIRFSLPDRELWFDLREKFKLKVSELVEIYRPFDNGHYVCVFYPDPLEEGMYTSVIINFMSLIVDNYCFDINSLCFVREEDFFYCGINDYMKRNLKNKNRLHLSWAPLTKIADGYLFMAAMRKENSNYAVRQEGDFTVNFPYDIWKQ